MLHFLSSTHSNFYKHDINLPSGLNYFALFFFLVLTLPKPLPSFSTIYIFPTISLPSSPLPHTYTFPLLFSLFFFSFFKFFPIFLFLPHVLPLSFSSSIVLFSFPLIIFSFSHLLIFSLALSLLVFFPAFFCPSVFLSHRQPSMAEFQIFWHSHDQRYIKFDTAHIGYHYSLRATSKYCNISSKTDLGCQA